ncbi:hypothetical protein Smic_39220 [Streptomyces microflavus]|uniref:Uncharacterized protein n=1 Tax=Streptomyces microflavus TaxID=1919 RepID=A0A7J0CS61_STRMI|nr:hypothetical protein Smic_39220 [Streptomyces microflavus]
MELRYTAPAARTDASALRSAPCTFFASGAKAYAGGPAACAGTAGATTAHIAASATAIARPLLRCLFTRFPSSSA